MGMEIEVDVLQVTRDWKYTNIFVSWDHLPDYLPSLVSLGIHGEVGILGVDVEMGGNGLWNGRAEMEVGVEVPLFSSDVENNVLSYTL